MTTKKMKKNDKKFCCENCHFNTCKKTNYNIHLQTQKHKNNISTTDDNGKNEKKNVCNTCEKNFNDRAGLWRHKKKCLNMISSENTNMNFIFQKENLENNKDVILSLLKQNNDFKDLIVEQNKMMLELCKEKSTNINLNNNSHNKTFNLQFFLNETCKDAMNIMDFIDSIKLQLSDLENMGKIGFVEGISNIIIKNLNELDVEKRPVHCTDSKREVLYVKDENKWFNDSKEGEKENKKIRKAIKQVAYKNTKLLKDFKDKYPDCVYSDSKKSDQYNKIIIESFNDSTENENKIIKKIAKEVVVDK